MADPQKRAFYLFDGYNLMNAAEIRDRQELIDDLASYLAYKGARGIVVFDGHGDETEFGPLGVRFATSADDLIERLAAERRDSHDVFVVTSDREIRGTTGQNVRHRKANEFMAELGGKPEESANAPQSTRISESLDASTRERLERLRRGMD